MKIHEYQAKQLFRAAGVAVPQGIVAKTAEEAAAAARAQVHVRDPGAADFQRAVGCAG